MAEKHLVYFGRVLIRCCVMSRILLGYSGDQKSLKVVGTGGDKRAGVRGYGSSTEGILLGGCNTVCMCSLRSSCLTAQ